MEVQVFSPLHLLRQPLDAPKLWLTQCLNCGRTMVGVTWALEVVQRVHRCPSYWYRQAETKL